MSTIQLIAGASLRQRLLAAVLAVAAAIAVGLAWHLLDPGFSHGPHGWVVFIQPPHVAAGFGIVRDHLTGWWEVQR